MACFRVARRADRRGPARRRAQAPAGARAREAAGREAAHVPVPAALRPRPVGSRPGAARALRPARSRNAGDGQHLPRGAEVRSRARGRLRRQDDADGLRPAADLGRVAGRGACRPTRAATSISRRKLRSDAFDCRAGHGRHARRRAVRMDRRCRFAPRPGARGGGQRPLRLGAVRRPRQGQHRGAGRPPRPGLGAGASHPGQRRRNGRAAAVSLCRLGGAGRRRAAAVAQDRMDRDRPRAIPRARPTHPDHE